MLNLTTPSHVHNESLREKQQILPLEEQTKLKWLKAARSFISLSLEAEKLSNADNTLPRKL